MHRKKSAVLFAAAWIAAIALFPAHKPAVALGAETALGISDVMLVVGDLPQAEPRDKAQPAR